MRSKSLNIQFSPRLLSVSILIMLDSALEEKLLRIAQQGHLVSILIMLDSALEDTLVDSPELSYK